MTVNPTARACPDEATALDLTASADVTVEPPESDETAGTPSSWSLVDAEASSPQTETSPTSWGSLASPSDREAARPNQPTSDTGGGPSGPQARPPSPRHQKLLAGLQRESEAAAKARCAGDEFLRAKAEERLADLSRRHALHMSADRDDVGRAEEHASRGVEAPTWAGIWDLVGCGLGVPERKGRFVQVLSHLKAKESKEQNKTALANKL